MRIVWSPLAVERAIEAARHIAVDNTPAAQSWIEGLFVRVERLSRFPQSGRLVPELRRVDVREIIHGSYRVIYRTEKARLVVLTIRHARRLLDPGELG